MTRKTMTFVVTLLLVASLGALAACQKSQTKAPMPGTGASGINETIGGASSAVAEDDATENEEPVVPPKEVIDASIIEEVSDFSDGCAWVETTEGDILVNTQGEILLRLDDTEYRSISEYSNGVALAYGNDSMAMIDKEGNPIWTLEGDGWDKAYELYGSDAVADVTVGSFDYGKWSGYLRVNFSIDTFDFTGSITGVVDREGNWVVEPLPLAEVGKWDMDCDPSSSQYWLSIGERGLLLYRTGEVLERTPDADSLMGGHAYGGLSTSRLENREECLFCDNMLYTGAGQFENAEGEVVLDISDLPLQSGDLCNYAGRISRYAFAYGDHCLATLQNDQGSLYLTVVDKSGNQMFEPIRFGEHGNLTSVAFFYKPDPTGKNPVEEEGYYIDVNGNTLGEVRGEDGTSFYENRAWLKVDDEWRCIDETGAIVI